jgi:hypothetical protein
MSNFFPGELISLNNQFNGNYIINNIECINNQFFRYYLQCIPDCPTDPFIPKRLYDLNFRPNIPTGRFIENPIENFTHFGESVSINSGNYLIIGAPKENFSDSKKNAGAVYIYKKINRNWILTNKLYGNSPFGNFGKNIKINYSGDTLFVSEPYYGGVSNISNRFDYTSGYGAVHIYNKQLNEFNEEIWVLNKFLTGSGELNSNFGYSIDIDKHGEKIIVGAPHQTGILNKGKVFVYTKNNNWNLLEESNNSLLGTPCLYGDSVAINKSGNDFVVSYQSSPNTPFFNFYGYKNSLLSSTVNGIIGNIDFNILKNRHNLGFGNYIKILNNNKVIFGNPYGNGNVAIRDYNINLGYNNISNPFSNFGMSFGVSEDENLIFIGSPNENAVYYYSGNYGGINGNVLNIEDSGKISYYNIRNRYDQTELCPPPFYGLGTSIASSDNNYIFGAPLTYITGEEFNYKGRIYLIESGNRIPGTGDFKENILCINSSSSSSNPLVSSSSSSQTVSSSSSSLSSSSSSSSLSSSSSSSIAGGLTLRILTSGVGSTTSLYNMSNINISTDSENPTFIENPSGINIHTNVNGINPSTFLYLKSNTQTVPLQKLTGIRVQDLTWPDLNYIGEFAIDSGDRWTAGELTSEMLARTYFTVFQENRLVFDSSFQGNYVMRLKLIYYPQNSSSSSIGGGTSSSSSSSSSADSSSSSLDPLPSSSSSSSSSSSDGGGDLPPDSCSSPYSSGSGVCCYISQSNMCCSEPTNQYNNGLPNLSTLLAQLGGNPNLGFCTSDLTCAECLNVGGFLAGLSPNQNVQGSESYSTGCTNALCVNNAFATGLCPPNLETEVPGEFLNPNECPTNLCQSIMTGLAPSFDPSISYNTQVCCRFPWSFCCSGLIVTGTCIDRTASAGGDDTRVMRCEDCLTQGGEILGTGSCFPFLLDPLCGTTNDPSITGPCIDNGDSLDDLRCKKEPYFYGPGSQGVGLAFIDEILQSL